jgi:hypothetical protein
MVTLRSRLSIAALVLGLSCCAQEDLPAQPAEAQLTQDPFDMGSSLRDSEAGTATWTADDGSLVPAFENGEAPSLRVELPARAGGRWRIARADVEFGLQVELDDTRDVAARVRDGWVLYEGAGPLGSDILVRVGQGWLEDYVRFDRPSNGRLRYRVDVSEVSGLRLIGGTLEFLAAGGVPRLRVSRPYLTDARGETRWAGLRVDGCVFDTNPSPPHGRLIPPPGAPSCDIVVEWDEEGLAFPVTIDPRWSATFVMAESRTFHTATAFQQGVLVAGGKNAAGLVLASTELYDAPEWTMLGALNAPRFAHTATDQPEEVIMVVGGLSSEEPYDPIAETEVLKYGASEWRIEPNLALRARIEDESEQERSANFGRAYHSATLTGGRERAVVVIGGGDLVPLHLVWRPDGESKMIEGEAMSSPRFGHSATWTGQQSIYVIGGATDLAREHWTNRVDTYDLSSRRWVGSSELAAARCGHTATYLPHVEAPANYPPSILVVGGAEGSELLDLVNGTWTSAGAPRHLRQYHAAVALPKQDPRYVLAIAGQAGSQPLKTTEIYDRALDEWRSSRTLTEQRVNHTATLLDDTRVIVLGGTGSGAQTNCCDVVDLAGLGTTCSQPTECASGYCSAGVCCDDVCERACETCRAEQGGPRDGECGAIERQTACRGQEATDDCSITPQCDGSSRYCPAEPTPRPDGEVCALPEGGSGSCGKGVCTPPTEISATGVAKREGPRPTALSCALVSAADPSQSSLSCALAWLLPLGLWARMRRRQRTLLGAGSADRRPLRSPWGLCLLWVSTIWLIGCDPGDRSGGDAGRLESGGGAGGDRGDGGVRGGGVDGDDAGSDPEPLRCTPSQHDHVDATWTRVATSTTFPMPHARRLHAMAADPSGLVLFGGSSESGPLLGDTWLWSSAATQESTSWSETDANGPPARQGHAMAYSDLARAAVLFGGTGSLGPLNDTWLWRDGSWVSTCSDPATSNCDSPSPRSGHRLAYDARRGVIVLFGGFTGERAADETWEWSEDRGWIEICGSAADGETDPRMDAACGPAARFDHGMTYDAELQAVVLYGGTDATSTLDDAWVQSGSNWSRLALDPTAGPGPRSGMAMSYDPVSRSILVFGGGGTADSSDPDVWALRAGRAWLRSETQMPAPAPRSYATLMPHAPSNALLLFGGGEHGQYDDTWKLSAVLRDGASYCTCVDTCIDACGGPVQEPCEAFCDRGLETLEVEMCPLRAHTGAPLIPPGDDDAGVEGSEDAGSDFHWSPGVPPEEPSCLQLWSCCERLDAQSLECFDIGRSENADLCEGAGAACDTLAFGEPGSATDAARDCLELATCCTRLQGQPLGATCIEILELGTCGRFLNGGYCGDP